MKIKERPPTNEEYNRVSKIIRFFRRNITAKEISDSYKQQFKVPISKESLRECLRMLINGSKIEIKKGTIYWLQGNVVYACEKCKFTSISRFRMSEHMMKTHVSAYRLGDLKQCKISVSEIK